MNVNFEYYKIFYYVAKYGSFTKAARALGSTQPNVTRAMNCLEQQLHNTLFIRTNRGIQLTPEGEQLYTHVSVAMAQLFIAEEELSDSASLTHGSVTIGATETALNIFLLCKLKTFRTAYPGIRLKIYNYSSPQAIVAVKSGKIDFAVLSTPVPAEPPLHLTPLQSFREILIGGPSFSALSEKELCSLLTELKEYGLLGIEVKYSTYSKQDEYFIRNIAKKFDLLPSGGSDFHGTNKPHISLGSGMGHLAVPYEYLQQMKEYAARS